MVSSRQLKHIVRVLVWGIIGIHIGLVVLLNIPSVQNKLASIVSSELGKLLKTEVSVGHIELGLGFPGAGVLFNLSQHQGLF